jgi:hypothetical protein
MRQARAKSGAAMIMRSFLIAVVSLFLCEAALAQTVSARVE